MGFAMLMPCHWKGPNTNIVFTSKVYNYWTFRKVSTWPMLLYPNVATLLSGIHQKADGDQYYQYYQYYLVKGGERVLLPQRLVQDPADDGGEEEEGAGVQ